MLTWFVQDLKKCYIFFKNKLLHKVHKFTLHGTRYLKDGIDRYLLLVDNNIVLIVKFCRYQCLFTLHGIRQVILLVALSLLSEAVTSSDTFFVECIEWEFPGTYLKPSSICAELCCCSSSASSDFQASFSKLPPLWPVPITLFYASSVFEPQWTSSAAFNW